MTKLTTFMKSMVKEKNHISVDCDIPLNVAESMLVSGSQIYIVALSLPRTISVDERREMLDTMTVGYYAQWKLLAEALQIPDKKLLRALRASVTALDRLIVGAAERHDEESN